MKRRSEILVSLGALALGVTLLTSLWSYLMGATVFSRPGVGKAPYNTSWPIDKAAPW